MSFRTGWISEDMNSIFQLEVLNICMLQGLALAWVWNKQEEEKQEDYISPIWYRIS